MTVLIESVRAELAPTGKLRAGVNYGNFILAAKNPTTGESSGVAITLMHNISRHLGVPAEIIAYDDVAAMGDAAPDNVWDIAFLGFAPQREALMSFTSPYLEIDATYLVREGSPFKTVVDVDRVGVRVAAHARANYELFLRRNLKHAHLEAAQNGEAAFELFAADKVDVLAGLTQSLIGLAARLPGAHMLEGRFMSVQQSVAVPKGRDIGLAFLRHVVEEAKASGMIANAIAALDVKGVSVAPPA